MAVKRVEIFEASFFHKIKKCNQRKTIIPEKSLELLKFSNSLNPSYYGRKNV
jgi:hypothetical protein